MREASEGRDFLEREESLGDLLVFQILADVLKVDADLAMAGNSVESQASRMGNVETKRLVSATAGQKRLAMWGVAKPKPVGSYIQVVTKNNPEQPASNDKTVPVRREMKPLRPPAFVARQGRPKLLDAAVVTINGSTPDVDFVNPQWQVPRWWGMPTQVA